MNYDFFRLPLLFIILCILQVFVFNHIQLFGCASPLLYVYFVLTMKKGTAKWGMMTWAFALGLLLDTFSNTPGVTAASMTLAAMAQPYLLDLFITREGDSELTPSMSTIGIKPFFNFSLVMVGGYCVVYFTLEMFSFLNWGRWLECVLGSTLVTLALVLAIDRLKNKNN